MTMSHCSKLILSALVTFLGGSAGLSQAPCEKSPANAIALTEKAILKRATKRVEPTVPSGFGRIDAQIEVVIVVGVDGKVFCAQASEPSHPLLRKYCEEAAGNWRFRPLKKDGIAVSFKGPIRFRIRR